MPNWSLHWERMAGFTCWDLILVWIMLRIPLKMYQIMLRVGAMKFMPPFITDWPSRVLSAVFVESHFEQCQIARTCADAQFKCSLREDGRIYLLRPHLSLDYVECTPKDVTEHVESWCHEVHASFGNLLWSSRVLSAVFVESYFWQCQISRTCMDAQLKSSLREDGRIYLLRPYPSLDYVENTPKHAIPCSWFLSFY